VEKHGFSKKTIGLPPQETGGTAQNGRGKKGFSGHQGKVRIIAHEGSGGALFFGKGDIGETYKPRTRNIWEGRKKEPETEE